MSAPKPKDPSDLDSAYETIERLHELAGEGREKRQQLERDLRARDATIEELLGAADRFHVAVRGLFGPRGTPLKPTAAASGEFCDAGNALSDAIAKARGGA